MERTKKGARRKLLKRMRCQICGKWNHQTQDCFILTRQQKNNSVELTTEATATDTTIDEASVEVVGVSDTTTQEEFQEGTAD
jgi:hypothetical protein